MAPKLEMLAHVPANSLLVLIGASAPRLCCDAFRAYELAGQ